MTSGTVRSAWLASARRRHKELKELRAQLRFERTAGIRRQKGE